MIQLSLCILPQVIVSRYEHSLVTALLRYHPTRAASSLRKEGEKTNTQTEEQQQQQKIFTTTKTYHLQPETSGETKATCKTKQSKKLEQIRLRSHSNVHLPSHEVFTQSTVARRNFTDAFKATTSRMGQPSS